MTIDSRRLVFVGGLHRSGTTPFARALAEHPDISGLSRTGVHEDEGQHLQSVYPTAKTYGGSGHFARDSRAHLTERSSLVTLQNAAALLAAWQPYWDLSRTFLVEKSPPNVIMTRFLQALFPDASFVIVVRHPVTVALSTKKWTRLLSRTPRQAASLSSLVEHWLVAHRLLMDDMPHVRRLHIVYYEDLIRRPHEELDRVRAFLGLGTPIPGSSLMWGRSRTYEQWWSQLDSLVRPGGWQRRLIERRYAAEIAAFGYDLKDLSHHAVTAQV